MKSIIFFLEGKGIGWLIVVFFSNASTTCDHKLNKFVSKSHCYMTRQLHKHHSCTQLLQNAQRSQKYIKPEQQSVR